MHCAIMVDKFVKQDVREFPHILLYKYPSTTGPLLPTMTDLHLPGRCYTGRTVLSHQICPSSRCLSQMWLPFLPVPRAAPSRGSMYIFSGWSGTTPRASTLKQCQLEASIALCFDWAGYLVPRDGLLEFDNIVGRTEWCIQRTLLFGPYL